MVRVAISASFHDDPEICNSIDVRKLNKHKYTRVDAPAYRGDRRPLLPSVKDSVSES